MSTTHTLPYVRFVRQARTEPMALLATAAAAIQAEALLQSAPWVKSGENQSTFPARMSAAANPPILEIPALQTFDAYKYCANYSAGTQRVYAGMAAYRFTAPADALDSTGTKATGTAGQATVALSLLSPASGVISAGRAFVIAGNATRYVVTADTPYTAGAAASVPITPVLAANASAANVSFEAVKLVNVAIPVYVDRWLVDGARLAVIVSDSENPPADWATLRDGDAYDDDILPMEYTDATPPARIVAEKNDTITIALPASTGAKRYIYVVVSLENYASTRGFWVEGAAILTGPAAATTFDVAVATDASAGHGGWMPVEAVVQSRDTNNVSSYTSHTFPVTSDGSSHTSENQLMASFPLSATRGSGVSGETGFSVGVDTSNMVLGGYAARFIHAGDNDRFTKLRFGNAAFLPLAGKTVEMRLNVWAGNVLSATPALATYECPKIVVHPVIGGFGAPKTYKGLFQEALFNGTSPVIVETAINGTTTGSPITALTSIDMGSWALQNIGQFDLSGKDYANTDVFALSPITGPGIKVVLVTIRPLSYWGTIGANTKTTWKPGEVWTLS